MKCKKNFICTLMHTITTVLLSMMCLVCDDNVTDAWMWLRLTSQTKPVSPDSDSNIWVRMYSEWQTMTAGRLPLNSMTRVISFMSVRSLNFLFLAWVTAWQDVNFTNGVLFQNDQTTKWANRNGWQHYRAARLIGQQWDGMLYLTMTQDTFYISDWVEI